MESSVSFSAVALGLSLIAFFFTDVVVVGLDAIRWPKVRWRLPSTGLQSRLVAPILARLSTYMEAALLVRLASVTAAAVAAVALIVALGGSHWGFIALGVLALWVFIAFVRSALRAVAAHFILSVVSSFSLPILILLTPFTPVARLGQVLQAPLRRFRKPELPASEWRHQLMEKDLPLVESPTPMDPDTVRMIRAVVYLERHTVREIMVPRVDITAVEVTATPQEAVELMLKRGHSRLPVYEGTLDNILGAVHARDLLQASLRKEPAANLKQLVRPAFFVPDSKRVDELLEEMQERGTHLAVVVDEYGGIAGLVTIEDVLEEIVGEISDEFRVEEPAIELVSENEAVVDARVSLEELNASLSTSLSGEGFDTLGGLVYSRLGKIPSPGDAVVSDGVHIEVLSTLGRRIKKIRVTRSAPPQEPPPAPSE